MSTAQSPRHIITILNQIANEEKRNPKRERWIAASGIYRCWLRAGSHVALLISRQSDEEIERLVTNVAREIEQNPPATIDSAMYACIRILSKRKQAAREQWIAACELSLKVLAWRDRLLETYGPDAISPEKWEMTSRIYRLAERREDAARQAYNQTLP